ncbi:DNA mismatch repair protein [Nocardia sp. SYP-A9097]|uniref:MutS-related protein n=1 Tax=Nocardia sp. SYP-A9097 TaxID=2663237 RepID=UPI00129ACACF|nr:DNA mismatch repair protein [Nocardia sp. SYP-A9097]MRH87671.1 DNA mismatch repair protein [Nocardia sp. SYP-A9097]
MIPIGLLQPPGREPRAARNGDAVAEDLGLAELYNVMAGGDEFIAGVVKAIVPLSSTDCDVIRHRQGVLADCCADPAMLRTCYTIATEATAVRRWTSGRGREPRGKLGLALQPLQALVGLLRQIRQNFEKSAGSCRSTGLDRLRRILTDQLDDDYLALLEHHVAALYFEHGMHFSAALGVGNKADRIMLHEPPAAAKRTLFGRRPGIAFEAFDNFEFHDGDPLRAVIEPPLDSVAELISRVTDNVQDFFRQLRTELAFYLGCVNLHERLTATGTPICFPEPVAAGETLLRTTDLRDVGLSLTASNVVGNDIDATGSTLLVVTGANSGGKSTFLRSVGIAQLLMQAGIFVTARSFTADLRDGVFTHFVRGEDPAMTHGRLDEELTRMRAITDRMSGTAMLLCNEPFASTDDRDAAALADPIVSALLDSGVKIVLVTHLYEFAHRRHVAGHGTDLFLRAQRDSDGRRTYRLIVGAPEPTSHGLDIFRRIFADHQVGDG